MSILLKDLYKLEEVWYVNFGSCNHMTDHEEWFSFLAIPKQPGVIEIGNNIVVGVVVVSEVKSHGLRLKGVV